MTIGEDVHLQSDEIIAALGVTSPFSIWVERVPGQHGELTVLILSGEPEDGPSIFGVAVPADDGWYLGCMKCRSAIGKSDNGMCRNCRLDMDEAALAHQQDLPWGPDSLREL